MTLLPCPHCGSPAEIKSGMRHAEWYANINCTVCDAEMYVNSLPSQADCEKKAIAAWNRRAVPEGFVLVPVESARFCAEKTKAMAATVEQKWGGYAQDLKSWQPHINALLEAVEAQENTNAK